MSKLFDLVIKNVRVVRPNKTSIDCLDIGIDLGSPVSLDYYDKAPFAFTGKIAQVQVKYLGSPAEMQEEKVQTDAREPAND